METRKFLVLRKVTKYETIIAESICADDDEARDAAIESATSQPDSNFSNQSSEIYAYEIISEIKE